MHLWVVGYEVWSETHGPALQPVRVVAASSAEHALRVAREDMKVKIVDRALRAEKVEALNVEG